MGTLHIAANASCAGSLDHVLRLAGRDDKVLAFPDDLNCGPIASEAPAARAAWWQQFADRPEAEQQFRSFWRQVDASTDRLIVWFSRWSAQELAFRLAWSCHMAGRPYHVIDVAGLCVPFRWPDGSIVLSQPLIATSFAPEDGLATLIGSEQAASEQDDTALRERWTRLKAENAPFRIVTPAGLISAPLDCFDQDLMDQAKAAFVDLPRIVGHVLASTLDPYCQVSDTMLYARIVALVESGKLIADGDPRDIRRCRVRLA